MVVIGAIVNFSKDVCYMRPELCCPQSIRKAEDKMHVGLKIFFFLSCIIEFKD